MASGGKNTTNITKGFDLSQKDINRLNTSRSNSPSSGRGTPIGSSSELADEARIGKKENKVDPEAQYKNERGNSKEHIHMIVIGHVDAGKSTLMGHMLWSLGQVSNY